jgi:AcrR family transcriptional regulator
MARPADTHRVVAKIQPIGQESRPTRRTERRAAILDVATELFAERGFNAVSVQDIADAAGTHKTTVLYHFETKESLREEVLDRALGSIADVMREFLAGEFKRERVAYLLDQQQSFFAEHPSYARLLQRELLDPEPQPYIQRFVELIYAPAVQSIERAMKAGHVRRIDPAFFLHDLHVQLIGYFCHRALLQTLEHRDPYSVEALIARRDYLVDQIFRQLTPVAKEAEQ